MKDKQTALVEPGLGLFLLYTVLHCVSMTVLVYLRYSFGYAFLRPKSFFLACTWAFGLFALYAWIDGAAWERQCALIGFGCGSGILYCLHLAVAVAREWRSGGEHDRYGGTSLIEKLIGMIGPSSVFTQETTLRLWFEPAMVLAAAFAARYSSTSPLLSRWLLMAAGCVWAKAMLNHWLYVRQRKRQRDMVSEIEDGNAAPLSPSSVNDTLRSARKPKHTRLRSQMAPNDIQP